MTSKTIIIGIVVVIIAVIAGYFLIQRNSVAPQQSNQLSETSTSVSSSSPKFNTNDNLDQALKDLDLIAR